MEQKINLPDFDIKEDLTQLSDRDITYIIECIIEEALLINHIFYEADDAEAALKELSPIVGSILLDARFSHLRLDTSQFVEFITYLTIRLA